MSLNGFDYKLTWDEDFPQQNRFDKPPNGKENLNAETHPKWKHSTKFQRQGNAFVIKEVDVTVYLVRQDNWVLKDKLKDELLIHEQGHYDIAALLAREFYRVTKKTSAPSEEEIRKKIRNLNEKYQKKFEMIQNERYDKQTAHGANKTTQETWNKSITAEKQKKDGSTDNLP